MPPYPRLSTTIRVALYPLVSAPPYRPTRSLVPRSESSYVSMSSRAAMQLCITVPNRQYDKGYHGTRCSYQIEHVIVARRVPLVPPYPCISTGTAKNNTRCPGRRSRVVD
eukprot:2383929-Rhodomonas_salina.2